MSISRLVGCTLLIFIVLSIITLILTQVALSLEWVSSGPTVLDGPLYFTLGIKLLQAAAFVLLFGFSHKVLAVTHISSVIKPVRQGLIFGSLVFLLASLAPELMSYNALNFPRETLVANLVINLLGFLFAGAIVALTYRERPHPLHNIHTLG